VQRFPRTASAGVAALRPSIGQFAVGRLGDRNRRMQWQIDVRPHRLNDAPKHS
jgi:hypothetical protein